MRIVVTMGQLLYIGKGKMGLEILDDDVDDNGGGGSVVLDCGYLI